MNVIITKSLLSENLQEPIEIDFTPPFARVNMVEGVEKATGCKIPMDDEVHGFIPSPLYVFVILGIFTFHRLKLTGS